MCPLEVELLDQKTTIPDGGYAKFDTNPPLHITHSDNNGTSYWLEGQPEAEKVVLGKIGDTFTLPVTLCSVGESCALFPDIPVLEEHPITIKRV